MLDQAVQLVARFMKKIKQHNPKRLTELYNDQHTWLVLDKATSHLIDADILLYGALKEKPSDLRLLRAHLMVSELKEVLASLTDKNELEAIDGLADLLVVTLGTAVEFKLPIDKAFQEVMRSNMTKSPFANFFTKRFKGRFYEAPRLKEILDECLRKSK